MSSYIVYIIIIAVAVVFFLAFKSMRRRGRDSDFQGVREKWTEIEGLMKSDSNLSWKMAVIEADKLLDSVLKQSKMRGETMGERLKFAASRNRDIRKVWEAHILRNDLVHESDRRLERGEAQRAMGLFKDALRGLGAL